MTTQVFPGTGEGVIDGGGLGFVVGVEFVGVREGVKKEEGVKLDIMVAFTVEAVNVMCGTDGVEMVGFAG